MRLVTALAAGLLLVAITATAGAQKKGKGFADVLPLPNGWNPEGIAAGKGNDLYVGSIMSGRVLRLDARTGKTTTVVPEQGRNAIGLKVDGGRIYVAGGDDGRAYVYDAKTGKTVADVKLTDSATTFVNDVTLTKDFAYFTDSRQQQLYRVDRDTFALKTIPITGALQYDADATNNEANGIAATKNGKTLYVANSAAQSIYTVDPLTGNSTLVASGLENADGILLHGSKTLYVVQNRKNQIAVVNLKNGTVARTITDSDFKVPTTIARKGNSLYAVNARFGTPPTPQTEYQVVKVRR